jgi:4'-phosphopantetheinyl transferase
MEISQLLGDHVHIWQINLDRLEPYQALFWEILSQDEKKLADRYYFDQKRRWFILRRGFLRTQLARYLSVTADSLRFEYSKYGKPVLESKKQVSIEFSISNSFEMALFSFTIGRKIGIDIEKRRDDIDPIDLAERYFSPFEKAALSALPSNQRIAGFFRCWSRKEAFIKAHGAGLWLPLDQFDVSLAPGEPAKVVATRDELEPADQWGLVDIQVDPNFEAALAVYGPIPELQFFGEAEFQFSEPNRYSSTEVMK